MVGAISHSIRILHFDSFFQQLGLYRLRWRVFLVHDTDGPIRLSDDTSMITITNLSRRFGSKLALDRVSLEVKPGCVFGLVGENGAGKSTLIKHILGLLRAETGTVRVFGLDPVADPVGVLSRIGYPSEPPDLPGWIRLDDVMASTRAFFPRWETAYAKK